MLQEHLYNIINNSIQAVSDPLNDKKIIRGNIDIKVNRLSVTDAKNKITSPNRIFINIIDNGGGVNPNDENKIFKLGFTTKKGKGGTGFGLSAAYEYMQSMWGGLKSINHYDKGFELELYLEEYTPEYHNDIIEKSLLKGKENE